jgi:hypothetical protein
MSTGDLPGLLGSAVNKGLLPLFEQARSGLLRVAKRDTVRDFKTASRLRAGEFPALARVTENAEYTSGVIGEQRETFALAKFGRLMGISYESLLADDTAALADMTRSAALAAAATEADELARAVTSNPTMADGQAVFSVAHANLAGASGALSVGALATAKASMRLQKGVDNATILNIVPRYLTVPAALEPTADVIVGALWPAVVEDSNVAVRNLEVVTDPRLDGSSATAWYLFADPNLAPSLSVAYLEGEEQPMVETRDGWQVDATELKVRFSLAAYWGCWRGAFKNAG